MRRKVLHIIIVFLSLASCISPGEIDVMKPGAMTVFGLVGEGRAPVIFIYRIGETGGFLYDPRAEVRFEPLDGGPAISLEAVRATSEPFLGTREFPFDVDPFGRIYYYSTPGGTALPARPYRVTVKSGEERGVADVRFPEPEIFENVSITSGTDGDGNRIDRLRMGIGLPGDDRYVKWEIAVNQVFQVADPATGDTLQVPFNVMITPDNYIAPEDVLEREGDFSYNLTANLPDYGDEPYALQVRLRSFCDDLTAYFRSVEAQNDGSVYDPFFEPITITSNLEGMFGVIGAYSLSSPVLLQYQR